MGQEIKVNTGEVKQELSKKFPNELREFYLRVGYGFICNLDKTHRDRVMDPHEHVSLFEG